MKVFAILEVDEKRLAETGNTFENEMQWTEESGISLVEYQNYDECSEYEYQAFIWDSREQKMISDGRPMHTEELCRSRLNERIREKLMPSYMDTNKVQICKRTITVVIGKWEVI